MGEKSGATCAKRESSQNLYENPMQILTGVWPGDGDIYQSHIYKGSNWCLAICKGTDEVFFSIEERQLKIETFLIGTAK